MKIPFLSIWLKLWAGSALSGSDEELQMATELDEHSETQLDEFDIENDLPAFLFLVLDKLEECFGHHTTDTNHIQSQYVVLDKTVNLLRSIAESYEEDRLEWEALAKVFSDILLVVEEQLKTQTLRLSSICVGQCETVITGAPGRPPFYIPAETLEDLGIGFSWQKIAQAFGVSRWTVYRRVQSYGLQNLQQFSLLTDAEIDEIVAEYLSRHGFTTGRTYLAGYLRSLGLRVQRRRVRENLIRVDPQILLCDGELLLPADSILYPGQILYGIWMATTPSFVGGLWCTVALMAFHDESCFSNAATTTFHKLFWNCS